MSNVRDLSDFRARRAHHPEQPKRTILPPADPRTFIGDGFRIDAGPGFIDITFEGRTKRFSAKAGFSFAERVEMIAMSAELMGEELDGG